jgi:hypothetical protein
VPCACALCLCCGVLLIIPVPHAANSFWRRFAVMSATDLQRENGKKMKLPQEGTIAPPIQPGFSIFPSKAIPCLFMHALREKLFFKFLSLRSAFNISVKVWNLRVAGTAASQSEEGLWDRVGPFTEWKHWQRFARLSKDLK